MVLEHSKPYLARAQLVAILNDKQSLSFPIDFPKFDDRAKITSMNVCRGMTTQLSYLAFFKDQFSLIKKFSSKISEFPRLDKLILDNPENLDAAFGESAQSFGLKDRLCMLFSPLRTSGT